MDDTNEGHGEDWEGKFFIGVRCCSFACDDMHRDGLFSFREER